MKISKWFVSLVLIATFLASCTPTAAAPATTPEEAAAATAVVTEVTAATEAPVATTEEDAKYGGTFIWGVGGEMPRIQPHFK